MAVLIKLKDYERIYKVVNSIVKNEGANPAVCCIFFSAYGSYVLSKHFRLNAQPRAGLAAYNVGGDNNVLVFGEEDQGGLTGDKDGFHCWVEADGWVLDFMAPAFSQLSNVRTIIPPKMFQKPLSAMASSPYQLSSPGDFYLKSSPASTAKHMRILTQSMAYGDLAEICANWFRKTPKKMLPEIKISDASGKVNTVSLAGKSLKGTW